MTCSYFRCRHLNPECETCTVDNSPCDMTSDASGNHCHQDHNESLCGISYDCCMMPKPPLMPFWACENICRRYDYCEET